MLEALRRLKLGVRERDSQLNIILIHIPYTYILSIYIERYQINIRQTMFLHWISMYISHVDFTSKDNWLKRKYIDKFKNIWNSLLFLQYILMFLQWKLTMSFHCKNIKLHCLFWCIFLAFDVFTTTN